VAGLFRWEVFSKRDNAEKLVKELQTKKYAAFTDQVDINGKILHRVLVGPEVEKKRAEQLMGNLNKHLEAKKLKGRIKRYQ
jgi:DedD protein